jgi:hypothetical protein
VVEWLPSDRTIFLTRSSALSLPVSASLLTLAGPPLTWLKVLYGPS